MVIKISIRTSLGLLQGQTPLLDCEFMSSVTIFTILRVEAKDMK